MTMTHNAQPAHNQASAQCSAAAIPAPNGGTKGAWRKLTQWGAAAGLGLLCASEALAVSTVGGRISSNFAELETIINATRLIVVAVAVIFSGYQIAFNNKRFGDVWPILLGGLIVGAAGGFATYFINLS